MDFAEMIWLFSSNSHSRGIVRLNLAEGAALWRIARQAQLGILEIGRRHGGSTCLLRGANPNVRLTSVDCTACDNEHCTQFLNQHGVELLVCDSRTVKLTHFYDVAFIDGDHSYEGVKQDYTNLEPSLAEGAIVIFHDAVQAADGAHEGVVEFVSQLVDQRRLLIVDTVDSMVISRKSYVAVSRGAADQTGGSLPVSSDAG